MNLRVWTTTTLGLAALLLGRSIALGGDAGAPVAWKKTVIDGKFRSEGVAIADVNRDGKRDVLIGDSWYEAPAWTRHDIRQPGDYGDGLRSYSKCMTCWQDDVNGDGWVDQLVIGFPGLPAYWYENPRGALGFWAEREIWPSACNETPLYVDLFGNGRRVLVMGWQPKGKDNEGQMAWFTPGSDAAQAWEMHSISVPSQPGRVVPGTVRFAHGLGVGDLNGDGRNDVICTGGWWEQPAKVTDAPWKFHKADLGPDCADMYAFDLDNDGLADIISTSAHQIGFWWHKQMAPKQEKGGSPTFVRRDLLPKLFSQSHALNFVDIDGDGLKDLVTGRRWWAHGPTGDVNPDQPAFLYWFQAQKKSDGTFDFIPHEIDNDSGVGTQFAVEDLNGDGLPDVIISNKKGVYAFIQVREPAAPQPGKKE